MSVEHERLKEILAEAADKETPEKRTACLDAACRGDAELRRQVEGLLTIRAPRVPRYPHGGQTKTNYENKP